MLYGHIKFPRVVAELHRFTALAADDHHADAAKTFTEGRDLTILQKTRRRRTQSIYVILGYQFGDGHGIDHLLFIAQHDPDAV